MNAAFPVPDAILYNVRASQPREVLRQMAHALEVETGVAADALLGHLMKAELAGGSGVGDGVAVVSCRVPVAVSLDRICAFARLARPVVFKGAERHACDLVMVMVSPESAAQTHIRDLSTIVRTMRDQDFAERLRAESATDRLLSLFRARNAVLKAVA